MYAPEELLLVLGWRRDVVPRCCPGAGVLEGRWLRCSRATSSTLLPSLGPLAFVWLILKIVIVAARVAHPPRPATALVVVRLLKSSPDARSKPRLSVSSRVRSQTRSLRLDRVRCAGASAGGPTWSRARSRSMLGSGSAQQTTSEREQQGPLSRPGHSGWTGFAERTRATRARRGPQANPGKIYYRARVARHPDASAVVRCCHSGIHAMAFKERSSIMFMSSMPQQQAAGPQASGPRKNRLGKDILTLLHDDLECLVETSTSHVRRRDSAVERAR